MVVRIEKEGWQIEASTLDDLRMGIQAVQEALDNVQMERDKKKGPGRPKKTNGQVQHESREKSLEELKTIRRFLSEIAGAGTDGITGEDLAKRLSLSSSKGLGNIKKLAVKILEDDISVPSGRVFDNGLGENKKRMWFRRNLMDDAIEKVDAEIQNL